VLGDINAAGERPVALQGRVPTKVNLEGGEIKIGDRIALSSVPGVGKRATVFEDSVGIAISNYSASDTSGVVMIFLDLQRGIDVEAVGQVLLGLPVVTISTTTAPMIAISETASSTATSSEAISTSTPVASSTSPYVFATSFLTELAHIFAGWFASAGNGIADLFAETIHAKTIYADTLCLGLTCVSEAQLQELLSSQAVQSEQPRPPDQAHAQEPVEKPAGEAEPLPAEEPAPSEAETEEELPEQPIEPVSEPPPAPEPAPLPPAEPAAEAPL